MSALALVLPPAFKVGLLWQLNPTPFQDMDDNDNDNLTNVLWY